MGTRGFLGWKIDGKTTTTYNHFDSYPSRLGQNTLDALHKRLQDHRNSLAEPSWDATFTQRAAEMLLGAELRTIRTTTETGRISKADRARLAAYASTEVSNGTDNYSLLRNMQGDLTAMLDASYALRAHPSWPKDSVFCEWGYLINFDLPTPSLEVYRGFQETSPTEGEWANSRAPYEPVYGPTPDGSGHAQNGQWGVIGRKRSDFFPVQRVACFPLSELPETMPPLD